MSTTGGAPARRGPGARGRAAIALVALGLAGSAGCASDAPRPAAPGDQVDVPTTPAPPTTMQDLEEVVDVTDRPVVTAGPPGDAATVDVTAQVNAVASALARRHGPYTGSAAALIDDLADEIAGSFTGCDVAPTVGTRTTSTGGTIDIAVGCDPTIDRVRFVLTLSRPIADSSAGWQLSAATRTVHCSRGVSEGLCV